MGTRRWLLLLLLPWAAAWGCVAAVRARERQGGGGEGGEAVAAAGAARVALLDAEIDAAARLVELYARKRALLISKIETGGLRERRGRHVEDGALKETERHSPRQPATVTVAAPAHLPRQDHGLFRDWFALNATFSLVNENNDAAIDREEYELVRMIAFQPNPKPTGRSNPHHGNHRKPVHDVDGPVLQFLVMMDRTSCMMHMRDPVTFEVVWQAVLPEICDLATFAFASDRRSQLALLTTSGQLALYNIRLWHQGRAIAGGFRRVDPLGSLQCRMESHIGPFAHGIGVKSPYPWATDTLSSSPPFGKHLHVDIELTFRAHTPLSLPTSTYSSGVAGVAITNRFRHNFVIVSNDLGKLTLFHAENGSFATEMTIARGEEPVTEFSPMAGGILAVVIANRVHFVDLIALKQLDVLCEVVSSLAITSIKADPVSPLTLYAGVSSGRGLVFQLRQIGVSWRSRNGEGSDSGLLERPQCVLVDQLIPHRPNSSTASPRHVKTFVQVLPGYLVLGSASLLSAFQLVPSSSHPIHLADLSLAALIPSTPSSRLEIVAMDAASNLQAHPAALSVHLEAADAGARLAVAFEALWPPPPPTSFSLSWVRFPAVLLCVVAALLWQQRAAPGASELSALPPELLESMKGAFSATQRSKRRF